MTGEADKQAFTHELFEYWIPRLAADGVDVNDVLTVRGRVTGWADWPAAWAAIGDDYRTLAAARLADGHGTSAGEALVRASLAYHCGQVVAFHAPEEKADLQARKVAAFREAAPLLTPPAERIEVAYDGLRLPGFLRLPIGQGRPAACVLLVAGLDSTKEDFTTIADMCARRGLASFAFDGPGQGEVRAAAPLAEGYEGSIAAAFEAIARRPEIDQARIGTLGRSLGGHYVVRAAAADPRIAACVLLVAGLDSTKEDFTTIADMCARRGLASFAFDGPGQGEVRAAAPLAEGYEGCIAAAFEAIARRPEIDRARIGTLGRSLGGHYVVRAAAADPRIAATVVFGGNYDLSVWPNMPALVRDGFRHATGAADAEAARERMGPATLDDCINKVETPVLVVHGKRDAIFHHSQATRIVDALPGRATLLMDEDGVHCCHNHAFQYRTAMADWLAATLGAD